MQRTGIPLVADLATDLAHCASACCRLWSALSRITDELLRLSAGRAAIVGRTLAV